MGAATGRGGLFALVRARDSSCSGFQLGILEFSIGCACRGFDAKGSRATLPFWGFGEYAEKAADRGPSQEGVKEHLREDHAAWQT